MRKWLTVGLVLFLSASSPAFATPPGAAGSIVFQRRIDGHIQLFVSDADGADERRLTWSIGNDEFPAWAPDGSRVAFWRSPLSCFFQCGVPGTLMTIRADGLDERVVAEDALEPGAAWSPDGRRIVFVAQGPGGSDLFTVGADGSDRRLLVSLPGGEGVPSWSPDGRRIAFASQLTDALREVWVVDRDGTNPRLLTTSYAINSDPNWSPDGRHLVFVTEEPGPNLWVMNADGSGKRRLTSDHASADPSWSPDGRRIVFTGWAGIGEARLFTIAVDGSDRRRVSPLEAYAGFPDWQPLSSGAGDLRLFVRPVARSVRVGRPVRVELLVVNGGPGDARDSVLVATLPRHVRVRDATTDQGSCRALSRSPLICALGDMTTANVRVRLTLVPTRTGRLTLDAAVHTTSVDVVPRDNRALVQLLVRR